VARNAATRASDPRREALPPSMRDRVPFLLYRAAQASHALANQMLARVGLAARQAGILTMISEIEPMTQQALADALRIDRTTMVALIDDLEHRGLVVRERHPRDRRAFLISPTEAGRAAKDTAVAILDEQQSIFLAPLTEQERLHLGELLDRLYVSASARQLPQAASEQAG
jgi:DNA-binding MarR family transcriptional regulator